MAVSATVLMLHAANRGPPLVLLNARALPWLVVTAGRRRLDLQRSRQPLLPWLGHLASAALSSAWQRGWLGGPGSSCELGGPRGRPSGWADGLFGSGGKRSSLFGRGRGKAFGVCCAPAAYATVVEPDEILQ